MRATYLQATRAPIQRSAVKTNERQNSMDVTTTFANVSASVSTVNANATLANMNIPAASILPLRQQQRRRKVQAGAAHCIVIAAVGPSPQQTIDDSRPGTSCGDRARKRK